MYDVNFKSLSPIHYLKVASSLYRCRQLEHIVQFDFDKLAESTLFWVTNTASGYVKSVHCGAVTFATTPEDKELVTMNLHYLCKSYLPDE